MKQSLFRKAAVERLVSPEQLDQLMHVTSPRGWAALMGAVLFLTGVVVWGFTGSIPTRVYGTGVLIKTGGVYDVVPTATGVITDVAVRPGDVVLEGQVLARLEQPAVLDRLRDARERLVELERHFEDVTRFATLDGRLQAEIGQREADALLRAIEAAHEEEQWLHSKIEGQEELLRDGLIRREEVVATRQQARSAELRIEQLKAEMRQVSLRGLTRANDRRRELTHLEMQVSQTRREVNQLEEQLRSDTQVRSTYSGQIIEVMMDVGSIAQQGRPLMRMDRMGADVQELEAVIYVPGMAGKRVHRGMDVQISPANVKREEHGFLSGAVTSVSSFPATQEAMNRILKNQNLVQMLSAVGAPYEVFVSLRPDPTSPDGYDWSSVSPGIIIQSGTLCSASITTLRRRPVELVAPFLRKVAGL